MKTAALILLSALVFAGCGDDVPPCRGNVVSHACDPADPTVQVCRENLTDEPVGGCYLEPTHDLCVEACS